MGKVTLRAFPISARPDLLIPSLPAYGKGVGPVTERAASNGPVMTIEPHGSP